MLHRLHYSSLSQTSRGHQDPTHVLPEEASQTPPCGIRPIVSGCSGPTEHISAFLDSIIKPIVPTIPSYIKDSSHMIALPKELRIPKNALLVTIDVSSPNTNIP